MSDKTLFDGIDAQNLLELMRTFYPKLLKDDILAPIFSNHRGDNIDTDNWRLHIKTVIEFWKIIDLGYDGIPDNQIQPDFKIPDMTRKNYVIWLKLFNETVDELYEPYAADYLKQKNSNLANSFMDRLEL